MARYTYELIPFVVSGNSVSGKAYDVTMYTYKITDNMNPKLTYVGTRYANTANAHVAAKDHVKRLYDMHKRKLERVK